MPRAKVETASKLRDVLLEQHQRSRHLAERFDRLGYLGSLDRHDAHAAALAGDGPVEVEGWRLGDALWEIGCKAEAREVGTEALWVVDADGSYTPYREERPHDRASA